MKKFFKHEFVKQVLIGLPYTIGIILFTVGACWIYDLFPSQVEYFLAGFIGAAVLVVASWMIGNIREVWM